MPELPYGLDRTIVIKARPETVFRFFTDSARWAGWWGAGSTIDATPGGKVYIRHPNGIESLGEVLEVRQPEQITFTYGFVSGKPMPPGSSRVTIQLEPDEAGTRLRLRHDFAEAGPRDEHVQGWRFQLSLFSNAVANEVFADVAGLMDDWFAAWAIADEGARGETLGRIAAQEVRFADRFSALDGMEDLTAHIGAAQRFMPGILLRRKGEVRQCQGTVIVDWVAANGHGQELMSGSNVFVLGADGRIEAVTGFASPPAG